MRRLSRLMESSIYVRMHNDSEHSHFASARRNCFPSAPRSLLSLCTEWAMTAGPVLLHWRWDEGRRRVVTPLNVGTKELHVLGITYFHYRSKDGIRRVIRTWCTFLKIFFFQIKKITGDPSDRKLWWRCGVLMRVIIERRLVPKLFFQLFFKPLYMHLDQRKFDF